MNIIIVAVLGLITLVSLLGNLYLIGYVLKETYNIKRPSMLGRFMLYVSFNTYPIRYKLPSSDTKVINPKTATIIIFILYVFC